MRKLVQSLLCAASLLACLPALAQAWPVKPVTLVVSTGSGTSPDRIARLLADRLSKDLGQSMLVENITGGGGVIAPRSPVRHRVRVH